MLQIPEPLQADDCSLLRKYGDRIVPVLAVFNRAVETANKLKTHFPRELEKPDGAEILARLVTLRGELTAQRYKVGFLGPFQCGKSTILNNLLGLKISGEGRGQACTSVVTRLLVDRGANEPSLSLRYFADEEYHNRRNTLCDWLGLKNVAGLPEQQVIERVKNHETPTGAISGQRAVLPKDKPYLHAFLQSYDDYKSQNLVREVAKVEKVDDYTSKDKILQHPVDGNMVPTPYLLLSEAAITFNTERIDPELELVDCPGILSGRSVDDLLTMQYIQQIHGALVFLRADALDGREVGEIFTQLTTRFSKNLGSRVWVVVNKMDVPERDAKLGLGPDGEPDPRGLSVFDVISKILRDGKIPDTQVRFCCNGIYRLSAEVPDRTAPRGQALDRIKLWPADEEALRARLASEPGLLTAFDELLRDGGVSSLRDLLTNTVGASVAHEILNKAHAEVGTVEMELAAILEQAEKPISGQEMKDALAWENALYLLLSQLSGYSVSGRGELFVKIENLAKEARGRLEEAFKKGTPKEILEVMDTNAFLNRLSNAAGMFQHEVDEEFRKMVAFAYKEVADRLAQEALQEIKLTNGTTPMAMWVNILQDDRAVESWWKGMRPLLLDGALIERLRNSNLAPTLDGSKYEKLMREKLRTAAYQIALGVRSRLRSRIDEVRRQVSRKLGPQAVDPAPLVSSAVANSTSGE